jgi:signal transduction histidine kinase/ligand-binding sensor domain-containing protein
MCIKFISVVHTFCLLIVISLLISSSSSFALDPSKRITQYNHAIWQISEGLLSNSIESITQTGDGYLWLGTTAGLVRFDGANFTLFDTQNSPQLLTAKIETLFNTEDGGLLLGTNSGLVTLKDGEFSPLHLNNIGSTINVKSIARGRDGSLWMVGDGPYLYRLKDVDVRVYKTEQPASRVVYVDSNDTCWIGTLGSGLHVLKDEKFISYTSDDGLINNYVHSIYEDTKGTLWIGTRGGLSSYKDGKFTNYTADDGLIGDTVEAIYEDSDKNLWIGTTEGGLGRLENNRFTFFTHLEGLCDESVLSIYEDREGNLWVGTRNGLNQFRDGKFTVITKKEGLSSNYIKTVYEASDGSMWFGTDYGGLCRLKDSLFKSYTMKDGLPTNYVGTVYEGSDGSIWFGMRNSIGRIYKESLTIYTEEDGVANGYISAIYEDNHTIIAISTRNTFLQFKDGSFQPYTINLSPKPRYIYMVHRGGQGSLWIASIDGLYCLQDNKNTIYTEQNGLPSNLVHAVKEDKEGYLWICTYKGLALLKDEKITSYTTANGLPSNNLYNVLEDEIGYLWINHPNGIFRISKRELIEVSEGKREKVTPISYNTADGMKNHQYANLNQPAGWKSIDGRLWFPTLKGVAVINPQKIKTNPIPPTVLIEKIIANNKQIKGDDFRLGPGQNRLEIHYTGLSLTAPQKVNFKYKLEGVDEDWVDAGNRRTAYYVNLAPGNYSFKVIACNNDSVWNERGAQFRFYIEPRFYQTRWFYVLCGVFIVTVALGLNRLRTNRMESQFAAVLAERHRIAREVHDTLLQSIVGIVMQLELISRKILESPERAKIELDKVMSQVEASLDETRISLWNLRTQFIKDGDLAKTLEVFARQILEGITIEIKVTGKSKPLSDSVEQNLLRIGQEALINIKKHANASRVEIELRYSSQLLTLSIKDNGCGFDVNRVPITYIGGYGLMGIKERVAQLNGELSIDSWLGLGTEVKVKVSL